MKKKEEREKERERGRGDAATFESAVSQARFPYRRPRRNAKFFGIIPHVKKTPRLVMATWWIDSSDQIMRTSRHVIAPKRLALLIGSHFTP